jgi:cytochrome d ubiquinol oxidase subunit II
LGGAVATFFTGSDFFISRNNMTDTMMPVISQWGNNWHGLDALANPWNVILGIAVFFLARVLGILYYINNIDDEEIVTRSRKALLANTILFLVFFLSFVIRTILAQGYAVRSDGSIFLEPYKYLSNLLAMPLVLLLFVVGVVGVLYGIIRTYFKADYDKGIWPAGIGTVLTVWALLLLVGYHGTSYYPSCTNLQSSLTIQNSSSSFFTLKVMSWVSILVPFVLAYIFYTWRILNKKKIDDSDTKEDEAY